MTPQPEAERTEVALDLAYEFASPFYAIAAGSVFEDVAGKVMLAFEKRCREVYKA